MSNRFTRVIYCISFTFFACFFIWPVVEILRGALWDVDGVFTLAYFREVFSNPIYLEGLLNAFKMAIVSTIFTVMIALPLAIIADRYRFPGKGILMGMILLPIMLPPFVGAIGIRQVLGHYGLLNTCLGYLNLLPEGVPIDWIGNGRFWGVIFLNGLSLYPILYLNCLASLSNVDPAMEEAAHNLGCKGIKQFFMVTLPLIRPGLFAGCTLVFIWAFTELGVPLIFDYDRLTSVQIFNGLKKINGSPFPYALVSVMLFFSILFYVIGKGLFGRKTFPMMAKATHVREQKGTTWWSQAICLGFFCFIAFIALLPHLAIILTAFSSDWYQTLLPTGWTLYNFKIALGNALTVPSIKNSLIYAGGAMLVNIFLGVSIAFVIVRSKSAARGILDSLTMLPLAVPGLVMAFGYIAMTQEGKLFSFLNPVENPTMLLIIAYSVRKLPFMIRAAVSGLEQTSKTYEEAAQSLGCSPLKASLLITIPLIMANILAGGLLAFSQSMLEVSDSLILAQKQAYYPITKSIYELMGLLGDGHYLASALGVWAMLFLGTTIIGASVLMGKSLGSIFKA